MILTADLGSTFLKAALAEDTGHMYGRAVRVRLEDNSSPLCWINALDRACTALKAQYPSFDLSCIMITGNGPTVVPVAEGIPSFSVMWDGGENGTSSPAFLPKIRYLRDRRSEVYSEASLFLGSAEFLCFHLTGKACASQPPRGFEDYYWNNEKLESEGFDSNKFPPFMKPGTLLGYSRSFSCIKEGTPVLVPCPDYIPAIVGSGAMHEGMLCLRTGTGDGLNLCSSASSAPEGLMVSEHPNGRDSNLSIILPDTGAAIERARKEAGLENTDFEQSLRNARVRKECEKICLRTAQALKLFKDLPIKEIRIAHGLLDSPFLNSMRASCTGLPVYSTDCEETGLQGLAIMASSYLTGQDITSLADRTVRLKPSLPEV